MRTNLCLFFVLFCALPVYSQTGSLIVDSQFPPAGGAGVALNASLALRFTSVFQPQSSQFALRQAANNTAVPLTLDRTWSDQESLEVIVKPSANLAPSTRYIFTATVPAGTHQFDFTTGATLDTTAPRLVSLTPEPSGGTASPFGPFRFEFSEPLLYPPWGITLVDGSGWVVSTTVNSRLSTDRRSAVVTYFPSGQISRILTVRFDPARVSDSAGNLASSDPGATPIETRFVTSLARDSGAPVLLAHYPEAGGESIPTGAVVQLLFDREMNAESVQQGGIVLSAGARTLPIQAAVYGRVVLLRGVSLQPSMTYRVALNNRLADSTGITLQTPLSFEFTTGSTPVVPSTEALASSPLTDENNLAPVNAHVAIRLPQPLPSYAALLLREVRPARHGVPAYDRLATTPVLLNGNRTLVLAPNSEWPALADVTIDLQNLFDVTGSQVESSVVSFRTSSVRDDEPPAVRATTPANAATSVPPNTVLLLALDKDVGVQTPAAAVRLLQNGEPFAGTWTLQRSRIEFKPASVLDPDTDYTLEWEGIQSVAGVAGPAGRFSFRTGSSTGFPAGQFRMTHSTLQEGAPASWQPLEFDFNLPLRPAHAAASVVVRRAIVGSSEAVFAQPVRIEVEGSRMRVHPLAAWPAGVDLYLQLGAYDPYGRLSNLTAVFQVQPEPGPRPEIAWIDPPPGTPLTPATLIRAGFSEPMLDASAVNGAINLLDSSGSALLGRITWSDDRRSVSISNLLAARSPEQSAATFALSFSSGLTSLAGSPMRAAVYRYDLAPLAAPPASILKVTQFWPASGSGHALQGNSAITIRLSGPASAGLLDRAIWVVSPQGRVSGTWEVLAGTLLAQFRPRDPWHPGTSIRLFSMAPEVDYLNQVQLSTAPAPLTNLMVVRTTVSSFGALHPQNAVLDIEFSVEPPAGPAPLVIYANASGTSEIPYTESRPRPRVRRLTLPASLAPGARFRILPRPASPLAGMFTLLGSVITVTAPLPDTLATVRYLMPAPNVSDVPLNTALSLVFAANINPLSVNASGVRLVSGGRAIPVRVTVAGDSATSLLIEPLELLPSGALTEAVVEGLEDRQGRPLPPIAWAFRTGYAVDLKQPSLFDSNGDGGRLLHSFDPTSPIQLYFDEPLDPASIDIRHLADITGETSWELSRDLRTLTLRAAGGWARGQSYSSFVFARDWAGNVLSTTGIGLSVGFDPDPSAPELLATSPGDGETDIPMNPRFSLLFKRPIGASNVRAIRLMRGDERIPLRAANFAPAGEFHFEPQLPLEPLSEYELILDDVKSSSGVPFAAPRSIRFTTGDRYDRQAPLSTIIYTTLDAPVRIKFSERIDATSIRAAQAPLTWSDLRGGGGWTRTEPVTKEWRSDTNELLLMPLNPLVEGRQYRVHTQLFRDQAGHGAGSGGTDFVATNSPNLRTNETSFIPPDGSTGVATNVNMEVRFGTSLQTPPVRIYQGGTLLNLISSRRAPGVSLQLNLKPGETYRIEFDTFRDSYDREIPGASSTFTTGTAADTSPLTFVSTVPAQNATGVDPATPWRLTFNKTLAPDVYFDGFFAERAVPFRYTTRTAGQDAIIQADPAWPSASLIQQTINPYSRNGLRSVADWSGNVLSQTLRLNFRTAAVPDAEPPALLSASPESGATVPAAYALVRLQFSEPVLIGPDAFLVFYGAEKVSSVYYSTSSDPKGVVLQLQAPPNSRVTILSTDQLRDYGGNPAPPFTLEYAVGEKIPFGPVQAELAEPRPAIDYPPTTPITIRFDRVMDAESVRQSIRVTSDGQNVDGAIEVLEDGKAFRFRANSPYAAKAVVRVYLLSTARDPEGWTYQPQHFTPFATFTIASGPTPLTLARLGFGHTTPSDSVLELEFAAELDPATINDASVWLSQSGRLVPGTASLRNAKILRFTPDIALEPDATYVLTAGTALRSHEGQPFHGIDLPFAATPVEPEAEIASIEHEQWQGRDAIRIRFTSEVSPLALSGIHLEVLGRAIESESFLEAGSHSLLIVPSLAHARAGGLAVAIENAPARNGRMLRPRREIGFRGGPRP